MRLTRLAIVGALWGAAFGAAPAPARIEGSNIRVEFDSSLHSRITARFAGRDIVLGDFSPSEFIAVDGTEMRDFPRTASRQRNLRDEFGPGRQLTISGRSGTLEKTVQVTVYDQFPRMAFFTVRYANRGSAGVKVTGWTSHRYSVTAAPGAAEPAFWSYQSGSYSKRPDWFLPLKPGFKQENYLGMNATDYGGGTPLVDVWRRDAGIAVGHLELAPKLVALPVEMPDAGHATLGLTFRTAQTLAPGAAVETFRTFVAVHQGDAFQALRDYSTAMQRRGVKFAPAPESAFGPIWCGWGYGKSFTPAHITSALPIVKKTRLYLGGGGRRLADLRRRLEVAAGQVPRRRPRHARPRG